MIGMRKHVGVEIVVIPHKTSLEIIPDTMQGRLGEILTGNKTIITMNEGIDANHLRSSTPRS